MSEGVARGLAGKDGEAPVNVDDCRRPTGCADGGHDGASFWREAKKRILGAGLEPFSLEHTLLSGQAFRWRKEGEAFIGVVRGKVLRLEQRGNRVVCRAYPGELGASELRAYLGLDRTFAQAIRSLPKDRPLRAAMRKFRGMRVLRQEPWETLISFIISANNNILRIKKCIETLCRTFGEGIRASSNPAFAAGLRCHAASPHGFFSFPTPDALSEASLSHLRQVCNLGYRDTYVKETARIVARNPGLLSEIAALPYPSARKEIMKLPGVGPKVADCVLLYSMGKYEAFPIDTWTRRILERHYLKRRRVPLSRLKAFVSDRFGPFAGYAQLYLFQYAMTGEV